jgi:phosphatidylethanolamine/phosphatidyl-N-methylethanolamine N-methyltransferase
VANFIGNIDWFDGDPTSLALIALAIVAFSLITAFAAAIGLRQARKPAMVAAGDWMPVASISEALDEDDDEAADRESKSRLQRRASIVGRRFRKSRRIRDNLLFFTSFAKAPRKVGSITPSSRGLGRAMAAELPDEYSVCVELGGGTGSLTSAILAAGVPSEKLIVVERDPRLAAHLRKRFPKVAVVEGDAQHLRRILADVGVDHVDAVVSGLPLRNLPGAVRRNIAAEVFAALGLGGVFVQFTYWGEPPVPADVAQRFKVGSKMTRRVWRNMPPANVWRYQRQANPD